MFSNYFYDGTQPGLAIAIQYDPWLVFLSLAVAFLAAYAGLNIAGRITASEKNISKQAWFLAGAFSFGIGAWTMHFVGVLALKLPIGVKYDWLTTMLSLILAILSGAGLLSVCCHQLAPTSECVVFDGRATRVSPFWRHAPFGHDGYAWHR